MDPLDRLLHNNGQLVITAGEGKYQGRAVVKVRRCDGTAAIFPLDQNGPAIARLREAINGTLVHIAALTSNLLKQEHQHA